MSQNGLPNDNITVSKNICGVGIHMADTRGLDLGEEDVFRGATKEIVFGSIAGMVSEVFEYPFDLAKVRLQAQMLSPAGRGGEALRFRGPMDCLVQTWKDEGFRGFYRGMSAPLAGSMAVTAALFLSYASLQNTIRQTQRDPKTPLSMTQLGVAAAGAGAVASFVLTPIELVKCKMQVQMMNLSNPAKASSSLVPGRIPHRTPLLPAIQRAAASSPASGPRSFIHDVACKVKAPAVAAVQPRVAPPGAIPLIRSIVATHGVRGLWLGHTGTLFRETGGCTGWFLVKEYVARALVDRRLGPGVSTKQGKLPLAWESALSGAMAGAVGALVLYPADTVKSAIQTEEDMRGAYGAKRKAGETAKRIGRGVVRQGFWRTTMKMYRMHGVKGLYAGCGMTVARAIPSSGIIFVVYDGLNNWFGE